MISSIHLLQIFFGSIIFVVGKSPMDIMELILAFLQPTTVDKHTKISSEEISDGREYSLLFLYVKVVVSCKVVGLYGARRRLTNWQDTLF